MTYLDIEPDDSFVWFSAAPSILSGRSLVAIGFVCLSYAEAILLLIATLCLFCNGEKM